MNKHVISGTVKAIYPEKHVSDNFNTLDFVVTIDEHTPYPQHITFQLINGNCNLMDGVKVKDSITVEFQLKGREWVDKTGGVKYFNTMLVSGLKSTNAE